MASGIEAAGFILAVLPLVVNQLDSYVQGIETIKSFRTRRYRREWKSWHVNLSSQRTIFQNNLEILLSDIDDTEDVTTFLENYQKEQAWSRASRPCTKYYGGAPPETQAMLPEKSVHSVSSMEEQLRRYLGGNYDVYMANMDELLELLQQLNQKFRLSSESVEKVS